MALMPTLSLGATIFPVSDAYCTSFPSMLKDSLGVYQDLDISPQFIKEGASLV
jgi:hypothetical protein